MKTPGDDMTVRELFEYSSEMFEAIVDNMVAKKDLEEMESRLASKDDLKSFVTKDYLDEKLEGMESRLAAKINNLRIVSA